jgi:hypothetical protein
MQWVAAGLCSQRTEGFKKIEALYCVVLVLCIGSTAFILTPIYYLWFLLALIFNNPDIKTLTHHSVYPKKMRNANTPVACFKF